RRASGGRGKRRRIRRRRNRCRRDRLRGRRRLMELRRLLRRCGRNRPHGAHRPGAASAGGRDRGGRWENRSVIDPLERWREYGEKPDFAGLLTFGGLPYTEDPAELAGIDVAVVGAPTDDLVSDRPGTRFGPRAIRAA